MTCLTGHVNKPGVYELPLGFPVKQMIEEVGGGIRERQEAEGVHSGRLELSGADRGGSAKAPPWITIPWRSARSMLGSGGVIIMDEDTVHGEGRAAHHALLRARKLRLVHPVPRRHDVAEKDPDPLP